MRLKNITIGRAYAAGSSVRNGDRVDIGVRDNRRVIRFEEKTECLQEFRTAALDHRRADGFKRETDDFCHHRRECRVG